MIDAKYQIRDNESEDEYIIRASQLGLDEGLTWNEIASIINEVTERYSDESTYRRRYKNYMMGLNAGVKRAKAIMSGTELPSEDKYKDLLTDTDNETKAHYSNITDKIPYYRLMRQDARFERFYTQIAEAIKQLPPPDFIRLTDDVDQSADMEYILGLADLHIGAAFECVNNSYSIDIAQQRFEKLLGYVIRFIQTKGIVKLKILSLGDVVQGILRISDLRLNEAPVVDAFVMAARMIADFLNKLSAYCYIDFYMVCYSNHDQIRPLGTKASELASEDLGKILYGYLTDVLALNDRVNIIGDTDKDSLEFNIWDFKCKAMHGHQVNNPATLSKDLANRDRTFYDYIFLGHTHSATELINAEGEHHNVQTLVLGSFVGSCPYADKLMVGSKASCSIYGFDKVYGHNETYTCILN